MTSWRHLTVDLCTHQRSQDATGWDAALSRALRALSNPKSTRDSSHRGMNEETQVREHREPSGKIRLGENALKSGGCGQHFAFSSMCHEAGASEPDQHQGPTRR
jgi:hypothetical protein